MYRKVNSKISELPPNFFKVIGVVFIIVIIGVPILLKFIENRIDRSEDYRLVIDRYSMCSSCIDLTGEKPTFKRTSYSSSGTSPRKYSYTVKVKGKNKKGTIKANLRKINNEFEIIDWTYKNKDTSILFSTSLTK